MSFSSFDSFFFFLCFLSPLGLTSSKVRSLLSYFYIRELTCCHFPLASHTHTHDYQLCGSSLHLTHLEGFCNTFNYEFDFFLELESSFFLSWDKQLLFLLDSRTPYSLLYTLPIFPSSTAGFASGI